MMPSTLHPRIRTTPAASPAVPRWADALLAHGETRVVDGCSLRRTQGLAMSSTVIESTLDLDGSTLRRAVANAYRRLFAALDASDARHVVRAWNFVPDILGTMDDGGDRYMSFNAGRYDAMIARFGNAALAASVPAATGIGHAGADLPIHLLACATPGEAVENPRQTPAYRYSPRYGPLPPCFARATHATLPIGPRLLVAGTAAIRGEATRFASDFDAQLHLTLENLRALLAADGGGDAIERFESLRAYVPPMADVDAVRRLLPDGILEIVPVSALCRADLLVEIEGVARTVNPSLESR